jgi:hypothetical protein
LDHCSYEPDRNREYPGRIGIGKGGKGTAYTLPFDTKVKYPLPVPLWNMVMECNIKKKI